MLKKNSFRITKTKQKKKPTRKLFPTGLNGGFWSLQIIKCKSHKDPTASNDFIFGNSLYSQLFHWCTDCSEQTKPGLDLGNKFKMLCILLMTKGESDGLFFLSLYNFHSWLQCVWPRPEFQKCKVLIQVSKKETAWILYLLRNGSSHWE